MAKEKKEKKKNKKASKIISTVVAGALAVGGTGVAGAAIGAAFDDNRVVQNIEEMGIDDAYYLENNTTFGRYEVRNVDTQRPVKIYLSDDYTEKERDVIRVILNNLTEVFEKMNSSIHFEVIHGEDAPKLQRFDPNMIVCEKKDELRDLVVENVLGQAAINLDIIYIKSDLDISSSHSKGGRVFLHELMHLFGLGDAYLLGDDYHHQTPTVMESVGDPLGTIFLSTNDMLMLASMYGRFENQAQYDEFFAFVERRCGESTIRDIDTSRPVQIYLSDDYNEVEYNVVKFMLNDLTQAFSKMNSGVQFELIYGENAPKLDKYDPNIIVFGKDNVLPARKNVLDNVVDLNENTMIYHEYSVGGLEFMMQLMYLFGFKDVSSSDESESIMSGRPSLRTAYLSYTDFIKIAGKYGTFETQEQYNEFLEFAQARANQSAEEYNKKHWDIEDWPEKFQQGGPNAFISSARLLSKYMPTSYFTQKYGEVIAEFSESDLRWYLEGKVPESFFEDIYGPKDNSAFQDMGEEGREE